MAGRVALDRDLPHREVAMDDVHDLAVPLQGHRQVVKERVVGRPDADLLNRQPQLFAHAAGKCAHHAIVPGGGNFQGATADVAAALDDEIERALIDVGSHLQSLDGRGRHGLQPRRLPDAAGRRMPVALRMERLSAAGDRTVSQGFQTLTSNSFCGPFC